MCIGLANQFLIFTPHCTAWRIKTAEWVMYVCFVLGFSLNKSNLAGPIYVHFSKVGLAQAPTADFMNDNFPTEQVKKQKLRF